MDKIVEQKIREFAFKYVGNMVQSQHLYALAARDGAITFDDIFFLGAVDAVQSQTLQALVEINPSLLDQHDERFKAIFVRLVSKHGIKMKAVVAVQRKLLEMMYTLFKTNKKYDKDYFKNQEIEAKVESKVGEEEAIENQ